MAREKTSVIPRKKLLEEKGTVCINCQQDKQNEIIFHHIIPISIGGQDILSNIVPLCEKCHSLVHFGKEKNISHSELIKEGLKKTNKRIGRPSCTIDNIPENFKNYYYLIKSGQKNITTAARELQCSRTTIYKYIHIIEDDLQQRQN